MISADTLLQRLLEGGVRVALLLRDQPSAPNSEAGTAPRTSINSATVVTCVGGDWTVCVR